MVILTSQTIFPGSTHNLQCTSHDFLQSTECMVDARSQFVSVHTCNCVYYTDSQVKEQSKLIV